MFAQPPEFAGPLVDAITERATRSADVTGAACTSTASSDALPHTPQLDEA